MKEVASSSQLLDGSSANLEDSTRTIALRLPRSSHVIAAIVVCGVSLAQGMTL